MEHGRLTAGTERVLAGAWRIAAGLGHSCVGTEHLFTALVLFYEGRPLFRAHCLSARELTARLVRLRGQGHPVRAPAQGLSPGAQEALLCAGPGPLTPEALLAALLRQEDSGACRLLRLCRTDPALLLRGLSREQSIRKEFASMQNTRLLEQFAWDMVARSSQRDLIIGRDREIDTVLQILSRRQKNNPALIGEPGVGKTAIAEGVAQRMAAGLVPPALRGRRLFCLDMASVIAGTKYRGEFEERVRDLLGEIRHLGNIILFIDEMHTLVGAGAAEGAIDAANLLKPALGRGELQVIGATTLTEYRKFIEKDAALERRFRTVQVPEATAEQTRDILECLCPRLEAHHHIAISPQALEAAVSLSVRYLSDKFLPDKAVDLLDEGAAWANMNRLRGREPETRSLRTALGCAVHDARYEEAAAIRDRLRVLSRRPDPSRQVEAGDIAAVVSSRTGIPLGLVTASERQQLTDLEETLGRGIVGQAPAIRAVAQAVRRGRSGLAEGKRPVAAMLFLGPTGVGKTELCKALARAVYGSEEAMVRLDMSEYMEKFSVSRLLGAPPGYIGHDEGGELSEPVRRRPYSLVLLDELEKAHRDVCGLLLQIMEDGRLTDAAGHHVDFRNTLLVMTSNLGADGPGVPGFGSVRDDRSLRTLRSYFPPEFLGRMDCIALFSPLGREALHTIADRQLQALARRAEGLGLRLTYAPEVPAALAREALGKPGGAREIRRLIQEQLEAPLAADLLSPVPPARRRIRVEGEAISMV